MTRNNTRGMIKQEAEQTMDFNYKFEHRVVDETWIRSMHKTKTQFYDKIFYYYFLFSCLHVSTILWIRKFILTKEGNPILNRRQFLQIAKSYHKDKTDKTALSVCQKFIWLFLSTEFALTILQQGRRNLKFT